MIIVYAFFRTTCGEKKIELVRGHTDEMMTAKIFGALEELYERGERHEGDFIKTVQEEIEIDPVKCFDHRGYELPDAPVKFLFDTSGYLHRDHSDKVRAYIMQPGCMPYVCTDLARLFYSSIAQDKTGLPAWTVYK